MQLFRSIKARIFLAFIAIGALTGAYGVWSVYAISQAGFIVKDTYDRPLMAINYARAAAATFNELRLQREELIDATPPADGNANAFDDRMQDLRDDLDIVAERTLSEKETQAVQDLRRTIEEWRALALVAPASAYVAEREAALTSQVADQFVVLTETVAADSFFERQKAINAIEHSRLLSTLAVGGVLFFAITLTVLLGRQILRPLAAAAGAADRISHGDMETQIPEGGGDETGALLRSMRIMQANIREMMQREAERRRSAEVRLAEALETASDAVILADRDGRIVHFNTQALRFFPELESGLTAGEPLAGALKACVGEPLWTTLLSPGEIKLPDGRWLRISSSDTGESGQFLLWSDITELKEREARYLVAKNQAEAASAAKSRFLANISHELKTPLNSIIGFSDILKTEAFGPLGSEQYKEYAAYILGGGKRILEIIKNVIDIANDDAQDLALEMEPVNLRRLLNATLEETRAACAEAELTFESALPDDLPWVWGDAERLERAFGNLLSNAVKFSKPGGAVGLSAQQDGAFIHVRVWDRGIGMRPEDIPIALSAFDQVDGSLTRRYEGAGLGLPFAKAVIDRHGGRLEIDTAPDKGAAVNVFLLNAEMVSTGSLSIPSGGARRKAG